MHVIVGAGAVGSATANLLAAAGQPVRIVTRSGGGPAHPLIERVAADATDAATLCRLTGGAAALYNCANPPYHRWPEMWPPLGAAFLSAAERTGAVLVTMSNLYGYGPVDRPMTEDTPGRPPRRGRCAMQTPAELGWRFVALGVVAPSAGCYDVLPGVATTPAARDDVVDRLGRTPAVGAAPAVASEDGAARQAYVCPVGHAHVAGEPDDRWNREDFAGTVEDPVAVGDANSLSGEDKDGGPSDGHDTQRLVGSVEN